MVWFILGACCGIAVCIFTFSVIRRNGNTPKSGVTDNLRREGVLNKRIEQLQGELLVARSEISNSRSEISGLRERIAQAENRVGSTDSLVDRLKEEHGLD